MLKVFSYVFVVVTLSVMLMDMASRAPQESKILYAVLLLVGVIATSVIFVVGYLDEDNDKV